MQDTKRWTAVLSREEDLNDQFFYAVTSTRIYCRPSCPSRRPNRENVVFFNASAEAEQAGFRPCLRCKPSAEVRGIAEAVCRYIEEHLDETLTLAALSKFAKLSPFHLQRTFKSALGVSPREYTNALRASRLKAGLGAGHPVTDAMYDAGYSSSSRLYERSAGELGMTPSAYRRGGQGERIDFTVADSPLGRMLVAATEKGICAITFGDSDAALEDSLHAEFPAADCRNSAEHLSAAVAAMLEHLTGETRQFPLPLDIRATAFQRVVWKALQAVPYGSTSSYTEIARAIGKPDAVRAVAGACASNRIAVAIPCHRVVHKDGTISGYRWGVERKKKLLEREKLE
ncbi:MAG: bifunctional DNA-binding transcriptional regulator/O6-methylguanine-DNA methyltransferase Ada [Bryobacteraceae bacterium]